MAEEKGFAHISVSSDDDDDFVVEAGSGYASWDSCAASSAPVPLTEDPAHAHVSDDGYRATTLEDIRSAKMSLTQKVIIALAFVGIAAFAGWNFLAG